MAPAGACGWCPCPRPRPSMPSRPTIASRCCRRQSPGAWRWKRACGSAGGVMSAAAGGYLASTRSAPPARGRRCSLILALPPIISASRSANYWRVERMAIRVGINGYGRIGRNILRALYQSQRTGQLQIVALNDLCDPKANAHLTRYDTVHGKFSGEVKVDGDYMVVNGDRIRVFAERDPAKLPWGDIGVDYVLECTGLFTSKAKASAHLKGGAKKVVISAPGGDDVDATIVYGVNHKVLKSTHTVISNASCTTNCLVPVVKVLHDKVGVLAGIMTTIHSYTNDQVLTDVYHADLRRARSATMSQIPTKTGAAAAVGLVMPELKGKLDGFAVRVPTINVSLVDLTFSAGRATSVEEVNQALQQAAASGPLHKILAYNDAPLVSVDFNHDAHSSIFDATLTKVIDGSLV